MNETIQLSNEQQKAISEFTKKVEALVLQSQAPISDQASLIQSGNSKIALESYVKAVKAHFEPETAPLEERLKLLKNQAAALLAPAKDALLSLLDRQRQWMMQEKARAMAETKRKQDEINRAAAQKIEEDRIAAEVQAKCKRRDAVAKIEEDFKAGLFGKREYARRLKEAGAEEEAAIATAAAVAEEEKDKPAPTVRVAPSIPAVAGVKNQTYYFSSVHEPKLILDEIEAMIPNQYKTRFDFLRRFLTVDATEVGKYAREQKNPNAVMAVLPGIKAWSNG